VTDTQTERAWGYAGEPTVPTGLTFVEPAVPASTEPELEQELGGWEVDQALAEPVPTEEEVVETISYLASVVVEPATEAEPAPEPEWPAEIQMTAARQKALMADIRYSGQHGSKRSKPRICEAAIVDRSDLDEALYGTPGDDEPWVRTNMLVRVYSKLEQGSVADLLDVG
jgi:hypothetical protein